MANAVSTLAPKSQPASWKLNVSTWLTQRHRGPNWSSWCPALQHPIRLASPTSTWVSFRPQWDQQKLNFSLLSAPEACSSEVLSNQPTHSLESSLVSVSIVPSWPQPHLGVALTSFPLLSAGFPSPSLASASSRRYPCCSGALHSPVPPLTFAMKTSSREASWRRWSPTGGKQTLARLLSQHLLTLKGRMAGCEGAESSL